MTTKEKKDKWKIDDELGFVPLPNLAGGTEQPVIASIDMALGVNKESKQQEGAAEFIAFMSQGKGQEVYMGEFEMAPGIKDVKVDSDAAFTSEGEKESYKMLNDTLAKAVASRGIRDTKLNDILGKELQNIATGQDPKEALQRVQDAADQSAK